MQAAAKATLESLVEERVASLIREAATVQRHTKRLKTTAAAAATTTQTHPITTFATPPSRTQSLQARHVHLALAWRGEEALLAPSLMGGGGHVTHSHDSPTTMDDPPLEKEKDDANHHDASARDEYHQDAPIDLSILLQLYGNQEHHHMTHHGPTNHSHYGPPLEVTLQCHWLAVHGVTPTDRPIMTATNHHRTTYYAPSHHHPALIRSDDDDHENDDDDDALVANHHGGTHPHHASVGGVSVRQLLPRLLSEELRLYFTRITLALEQPPLPPSSSSSSSLQVSFETQEAALESVARDSGTQELVPFFVRYVALQLQSFLSCSADDSSHTPRKDSSATTTTTTTTQRARTFVRLAKALLDNPNLHLELFLHQLLPALLSCVVASKSSSSSNHNHILYNEEEEDDSHWYLREEAAAVVVQLAHQFGSQYTTLQARILETLCRALNHNHSHDNLTTCQNPETLYGGLVGMRLFGPRSIDAFVIPLVATIWTTTSSSSTGQEEQPQSSRNGRDNMSYCQFALLEGLGLFLRHVSLHEQAQRLGKQHPEVASALGETLVYLLSGRMADNDDNNDKPTKHPGDPHSFPQDDSYHGGGWQPSAYSTCIL